MDTKNLRERLLSRERELLGELSRLEDEARDSRSAEVEDPIDEAISSQNKDGAFHIRTIAAAQLTQVRDALRRYQDGKYGICIDCGRPIEPARLEAVPWTPYCLDDQEKHDRTAAAYTSAETI